MKVLKVFFLGLVYGWFMRWIIDEIYLKDNLRMITEENLFLKERVKSLEAPKALETLSVQRTAPVPQTRPASEPKTVSHAATKDDLKSIKGVGPAMEKKLNAAGVNTFEQLSRLTTAELQNILGISKRVTQSADNLLTQARQLAQEKAKR
jgi:predicted flap endonuclease-1-like 5' DNA nuclease